MEKKGTLPTGGYENWLSICSVQLCRASGLQYCVTSLAFRNMQGLPGTRAHTYTPALKAGPQPLTHQWEFQMPSIKVRLLTVLILNL